MTNHSRALRSGRLTFALAASLLPAAANAQVYTSAQFAAPYVQLASGTPVTFGSPDDDSTLVPIGFGFTYFGVTYTHVNVATNGFAVLAAPCTAATLCPNFGVCAPQNVCELGFASTSASGPFPDITEPNLVFAPFWDDLFVTPTAQVLTGVEGSAPNRTFVIEWRNIQHFPSGTVGSTSFQIRLGESGAARLAWGGPTTGTAWSGDIGVENDDGTIGFVPNLACAGPGGFGGACQAADLTALSGQVLEVSPVEGPELIGLVNPPPGADPGDTVAIGLTARNIGTLSTTVSITARAYLSPDTTITPGMDAFLGEVALATVPARGARTATLTAVIPAMLAPGYYRIGVIVDATNRVIETLEGNNVGVSGAFLIGPNVSAVVTAPASTGPSEPLDASVTITSNGSPVAAVGYSLYLSTDQTFDAMADLLIGTGTAAVGGAPTHTFDAHGVVPANIIPAAYYVIVRLDPNGNLTELDETDNIAVSGEAVDVVGPDVAVTAIDGDAAAYRGQPYTVHTTLRNLGGTTAFGFTYTFYLSDNQLVTATDPVLCEFGPIDLAPSATLTLEHVCTVPATVAVGPYYLGAIADSNTVVLEGDERNNIRFRRPTIDVRDPAPDFLVQELTVPAVAAVGESFSVGRTFDNAGNAPGTAVVAVYLSSDATYDAADVEIGRGMVTAPAFGRVAGVDQVRIPLGSAPGVYSVIVRLDPDGLVAELDEANNDAASTTTVRVEAAQLQVLSRLLPQGTVGLPYQVDLAAAGGSGRYTWSVVSGALPAGVALDAATGRIRGTPEAPVQARLTFRVDDGASHTDASLALLVAESSVDLDIITRALPPAFIGRPYELPMTAIGGIPPYVWSVNGMLPPGFTLSADGVLTGMPTSVGALPVNFQVTDVAMTRAERPVTVRVIASEDALRFTNDVLRDGTVGRMYEGGRFRATNGQAPYSFALVDGRLPPGLSIDGDLVVGTPTVAGTFIFAVRVTDQRADFDTNRFVVNISPDEGVRFVSNSLPGAVVGKAYVEEGGSPVRLKAVPPTGLMGELSYAVIAGDLPPGLTLAADGVISGAPTASGLFTFTAEVSDEADERDHRALAIVVDEPPPAPPEPVEPEGCGCAATDRGTSGAPWAVLAVVAWLWTRRRRAASALAAALASAVAVVAGAPGEAHAQGVPYFLQEEMQPYTARSGTALTFPSNDDSDNVVTLPFPFHFFSTDYSTVNVGTNGYVAFGQSATSLDSAAFDSTATPNNVIAVFWDDLIVTSVQTTVEGTAPGRVFIIQWVANRFGGGGNVEAQLWLYEGPAGRFEIHYGNGQGTSFTASLGFEDNTGMVSHSWRTCSPNCTGADLSALNGMVLRGLQDGGPDVVATSVTSPRRTYAGTPFQVTGVLTSLHQNPVGPFSYGYLLFPASGPPGAGVSIGGAGPVTLTPYQTLTVMDDVTIPVLTAPGAYRVALVVDPQNTLAEPDETNNTVLAAANIDVGERRPDFTGGRIVARPAAAHPGDTVSVLAEVTNAGNLDGATEWRLVLSRNRVISMDDTTVHSARVTLPFQTSATATVSVPLPADLEPGSYYFGILADPMDETLELSEVNNAVAAQAPLAVGVDTVEVASDMLPGGYVGVDYSTFLRGSGGDGTYAWSIAAGTLPAGITLLPMAGEIRGRPTAAGRADITVRVTSAGRTAEKMLSIDVAERRGPLTIATTSLLPGVVGQSYPPVDGGEQQRLQVVNASGDVTFRVTSNAPTGLELTADGVLTGVPRQRGVFDIAVEARDTTGTATRTIPLTIVEPGRLTVIAATLPGAVLDDEYRFQLQAVGSTSTVTFALSAGEALPDGLSLTSAGLLVGVPQRVGTWRFSVEAREGTAVDAANFTLQVTQGAGFGITPSSLPVAVRGQPYEARLEARGGLAPLQWTLVTSGTLPRGIRFEVERTGARETLRFLGTPEAVPDTGASSFLVVVEDFAGRHAELPMAIRVTEPEVTPAPLPTDEGGCSCASAQGGGAAGLAGWLVSMVVLAVWRRRSR